MAVTKEQVLDVLGKVAAPNGTPLPRTGTLSEIVAGEKVFFSINVDAAVAQAWEPVRKNAEAAVKAMPGVQSVMVALTAEKKGGAGAARPPQGGPATRGAARSCSPAWPTRAARCAPRSPATATTGRRRSCPRACPRRPPLSTRPDRRCG
jgi:ATP-binding protein involved in chromosome partitioning